GGRPDKESEAHVAQATQHVHAFVTKYRYRFQNPRIRKLVASLLSLDPASRPLPLSLLMTPIARPDKEGDDKCEEFPLFPKAFGEALLPLCVVIQSNPVYMAADMRIDLLVHNLPYLILMLVPRDILLEHLKKIGSINIDKEPEADRHIFEAVRKLVSRSCPDVDNNTLSAAGPQVYESSQIQQFTFFQNQEYVHRPEATNGEHQATTRSPPAAYAAVLADWEKHLSRNMTELLLLLFPTGSIVPEAELEGTDGSNGDRDVLFVVVGMITSAGHAGSHPRARQALRSLVAALECIPHTADTEESLYASGQFGGVADTGSVYSLFVDYLWPVLLSLIATRSDANLLSYSAHAAVKLAELSVIIAEMSAPSGDSATSLEAIRTAMHTFVATYLQQVFQRAPPGNNFSARTPSRVVSSSTASTHSPDPAHLPPRAAEAVKLAVLEALPEFAALLPPCSQEPDSAQNQNIRGPQDAPISSLTVPPIIAQSLSPGPEPSRQNKEESGGKSPDRGLTLPYLMCFLNDPNPQVRVAFCRLAPKCANVLGPFAADVALLPYFTQTLSKEVGDDRLTLAALMGATELLEGYKTVPDEGPNSVHRESVMRFAESAVPYLCHPNVTIQAAVKGLLCNITKRHIGEALQYVYLRRRAFADLRGADYLPKGWRCFADLEGLYPVSYDLVLGQQATEVLQDKIGAARIELAKKFYRGPASHGVALGEPGPVSTSGPMQIIRVPISNPNVPAILPYSLIAEADGPLGFEGHETLYVSRKKLQIVNEIRGVLGSEAESYGMYGHRRVRAQRLHLQCRAGVDPPTIEATESQPEARAVAQEASPVAADHNSKWAPDVDHHFDGSLCFIQSASIPPAGGIDMDSATGSNDSSGYSLATPTAWRPGGFLVGTIYDFEYDFGDAVIPHDGLGSSAQLAGGRGAAHRTPVVAVDASDDGRLIMAMGGNGTLRAWRGHILEEDIAPTSSKIVTLPDEEIHQTAVSHYNFPMKAMRNCKSVVVGGSTPSLYVYRMDAPGNEPVVSFKAPTTTTGTTSVLFDGGISAIESLDTDVENVVVAANHHGSVFGFDVRAGRCVFSVAEPDRPVGVPTSILCSSDGRTTVLGTRSGFVRLFDVRYLSHRTRTYKLSQEGAGVGVLPITAMCNSFQGGNKSFWLAEGTRGMMALYDFTSLDADIRPIKLMLSAEQPGSINLPVLADMGSQPRQNFLVGADVLTQRVKECADPSSLTVRSMLEISTSRGGPWTLLSAGNDAIVRYWQPQEAGIAVPLSNQSPRVPLQLGGVQVMTNPRCVTPTGSQASTMARAQGSADTPAPDEGDFGLKVADGHRDTILDMCVFSLQYDVLVTAGRDGLIKIWR
ncbi:phosphoinositide-3-kinase, regulatory subunit 4, partial [Perkinsus olseni]